MIGRRSLSDWRGERRAGNTELRSSAEEWRIGAIEWESGSLRRPQRGPNSIAQGKRGAQPRSVTLGDGKETNVNPERVAQDRDHCGTLSGFTRRMVPVTQGGAAAPLTLGYDV